MRSKFFLFITLVFAFVQGSGAEANSNVPFNFLPTEDEMPQPDNIDGNGMVNMDNVSGSTVPTLGAGNTNLVGDVNHDGEVSIMDVTALIDMLISGDFSDMAGDVNQDGMITIMDVTTLIDLLLHVPEATLYSTILVTTTDGTTAECLIDENTRLRIMKPDLVIETNGMVMTYDLANMAQLCYGQRTVTLDESQNLSLPRAGTVYLYGMNENTLTEVTNAEGMVVLSERGDAAKVQLDREPSGEYVINADGQTIKIVKL